MRWYNPSTYSTFGKLLFLAGLATVLFGSIACLNVTATALMALPAPAGLVITLDQRIACTAVCADTNGALTQATLANGNLRCMCEWAEYPEGYRPALPMEDNSR